MKIILLILLFTVGCTHLPKGSEIKIQAHQCFVKWSDNDYKLKYNKGIGLSREEKITKNILFPMWQNGGVFILEDLENDYYGVIFDRSDKNSYKIIESTVGSIFTEIPDSLISTLAAMKFKLHKDHLLKILQGYEPVDCKSYLSSQVL